MPSFCWTQTAHILQEYRYNKKIFWFRWRQDLDILFDVIRLTNSFSLTFVGKDFGFKKGKEKTLSSITIIIWKTNEMDDKL